MKLKLKDNLFRVNDTIISYDTEVATISGKKLIEHGKYSRTTSKHISHVASLYGLEIVRAKEKEPFYQYEYGVKCELPGTLSRRVSEEISDKMGEGMDYLQAVSIVDKIGKKDWEIITKDLNKNGISMDQLQMIRKATLSLKILG
jgi:hypothetical protein